MVLAVFDEPTFQILVLVPVWLTFLIVIFGAWRGRAG